MNDDILAYVWFLGGVKRPVFEDNYRRQYVLDDEGERVYGVWFIPEEELVQPDVIIDQGEVRTP